MQLFLFGTQTSLEFEDVYHLSFPNCLIAYLTEVTQQQTEDKS